MRFDLRAAIGLLFLVYGVILTGRGALYPVLVLGINVNFYWGLVLLLVGIAAGYLSARGTRH